MESLALEHTVILRQLGRMAATEITQPPHPCSSPHTSAPPEARLIINSAQQLSQTDTPASCLLGGSQSDGGGQLGTSGCYAMAPGFGNSRRAVPQKKRNP